MTDPCQACGNTSSWETSRDTVTCARCGHTRPTTQAEQDRYDDGAIRSWRSRNPLLGDRRIQPLADGAPVLGETAGAFHTRLAALIDAGRGSEVLDLANCPYVLEEHDGTQWVQAGMVTGRAAALAWRDQIEPEHD